MPSSKHFLIWILFQLHSKVYLFDVLSYSYYWKYRNWIGIELHVTKTCNRPITVQIKLTNKISNWWPNEHAVIQVFHKYFLKDFTKTYIQEHFSVATSETIWLYVLGINFKINQIQSVFKFSCVHQWRVVGMHTCRYWTSIPIRSKTLIIHVIQRIKYFE